MAEVSAEPGGLEARISLKQESLLFQTIQSLYCSQILMIKIDLHKTLSSKKDSFRMNLDFTVEPGDFISVYGPSGAGKTSLLKQIAGLSVPDKGQIIINEKAWYDSSQNINLTPQQRQVGMVFQDYALFPNMTVRQNLEYALQKGQSTKIVDELIDIIELKGLEQRKPDTLSGGQKQRVGLARALVQQPEILLLDEPLSALDDQMRQKLQDYILMVHEKYNLTTFLVSHDISEIFKMANKVVKVSNGQVEEFGSPESLFLNQTISGKYQSVGTILSIQPADVVNIVKVLSGNMVIEIIATDQEAEALSVGDKVMVVSKAFNPILIKV